MVVDSQVMHAFTDKKSDDAYFLFSNIVSVFF